MGGIGSWELILIMFVALVVFGAKRIPEIARGLGKGLNEFKRAARDIQDEIGREIDRTEFDIGGGASRQPPGSPELTAPPRDQAEFEPKDPTATDPPPEGEDGETESGT
jgi:sec-independent protein translocase protein TatA